MKYHLASRRTNREGSLMRLAVSVALLILSAHQLILLVQGETCFGVASTNAATCSGRGACSPDEYCTCKIEASFGGSMSPFSGLNCEMDLCFPSAVITYNCNGNGKCESGVCNCVEGTSGLMCQLNTSRLACFGLASSDSRVCSGNGKCLDTNVCSCLDGYAGTECQIPLCYGIPSTLTSSVCSGRGTCKGRDTCECQSGYSGANCETVGSGQSAPIVVPSSFCDSIIESDSKTCNGRGKCIANDTCICASGYDDRDMCKSTFCHSIPQNDSLVCSGHGQCIDYNICNCSSYGNSTVNYIGSACETVQCLGRNFYFFNSSDLENVCSGNGVCSTQYGGCQCKDGYFGDACEQYSCFGISSLLENSCSGHGQCVDLDKCSCFSNSFEGFWTGENCDMCEEAYSGLFYNETLLCQSESACNQLGSCLNSTCQCDERFSGAWCSECEGGSYGPLCNESCSRVNTCHGHGDCARDGIFCECDKSINDGFWDDLSMCQKCLSGYYGSSCLLKISETFTLNSLGNEILIPLLIRPNNVPNLLNCSTILSLETRRKLGNLPECWIDSSNVLRIAIPKDATFSPILNSDRIILSPSGFDNSPQKNESISIVYDPSNSKLVLPVAKIYINSTFILPQSDLVLIGSNKLEIERERNLTYQWSLKSSDSDLTTFRSNIISRISNGKFGQLIIYYSDIPSNVKTFQIQLILKNDIYNISSDPIVMTFTLLKSTPIQQVYNGAYRLKFNLPTQILYVHNDMLPYKLTYNLLQDESQISLPNSSYTFQFSISPTPSDNTFVTLANSNGILTISSAFNYDVTNGYYEGFDNQEFNTSKVYQITGTVTHVPSGKVVAQQAIKTFFISRYSGTVPDFELAYPVDANQAYPMTITVKRSGYVFDSVDWDCIEWGGIGGKCSNEWVKALNASKNSHVLTIPLDTFYLAKNPLYVRAKVVIAGTPYYIQSAVTPGQGFGFKTFNGATLVSVIAGIQLAKIDRTNTHTAIYSWMTYQFTDTANGASVTYTVTDQDDTVISTPYISLDTNQRKFTINGASIPANVKALKISVQFTVPNFANFKYRAYLYLVPDSIPQPTPTSTLNYTTLDNGLRKYVLNYQLTESYFASKSDFSLKIGNNVFSIASTDPRNTQTVKFILPPLIDASSIIVDVTYVDNRYVGGVSNLLQRFTLQNLPAESLSSNTFISSIQNAIHTDANNFLSFNANMGMLLLQKYLGEEYIFPTM